MSHRVGAIQATLLFLGEGAPIVPDTWARRDGSFLAIDRERRAMIRDGVIRRPPQ